MHYVNKRKVSRECLTPFSQCFLLAIVPTIQAKTKPIASTNNPRFLK